MFQKVGGLLWWSIFCFLKKIQKPKVEQCIEKLLFKYVLKYLLCKIISVLLIAVHYIKGVLIMEHGESSDILMRCGWDLCVFFFFKSFFYCRIHSFFLLFTGYVSFVRVTLA